MKKIGIQRGARFFLLRGGFIKQNENFEKSQKLNGLSDQMRFEYISHGSEKKSSEKGTLL
jgi:hypothetical protein